MQLCGVAALSCAFCILPVVQSAEVRQDVEASGEPHAEAEEAKRRLGEACRVPASQIMMLQAQANFNPAEGLSDEEATALPASAAAPPSSKTAENKDVQLEGRFEQLSSFVARTASLHQSSASSAVDTLKSEAIEHDASSVRKGHDRPTTAQQPYSLFQTESVIHTAHPPEPATKEEVVVDQSKWVIRAAALIIVQVLFVFWLWRKFPRWAHREGSKGLLDADLATSHKTLLQADDETPEPEWDARVFATPIREPFGLTVELSEIS